MSGKDNRRKDQNKKEANSEFEEKVLYINRCSKVVKGGRKFSFSALVIAGDGKGRIGVGFAKANEVADAIRKGSESARKDIRKFVLHEGTIPHIVESKWDGARVLLKPAPDGTGVIAGSKVRAVLEIAGVKDIVAKSYGSNNANNQVAATVEALMSLRSRKECLELRKVEA
ncbi:MAG: 30S ribosomal protein S5 [Chlamydiia bacterium]|nr:30S ribosomal protein S5 [Chlamydiia bacterium]MCH9616565.1 30S ribosomal protein S5 [Chlamydiia bacterium]MCH9629295.1 30S ribosomal protein S5 [Chlamydiia bacterium]